MWLLTVDGMYSVVQKRGDELLTVRVRVASDLDRLRRRYLPQLTATVPTPGNDYAYRARVSHASFASDDRQGHDRAFTYQRVWQALHDGLPHLDASERISASLRRRSVRSRKQVMRRPARRTMAG